MAANRPRPQHEPGSPSDVVGAGGLALLLERASGGDESAWTALVRAYLPRVFAMAKSRCRSHDVAEEIAQSVFVTIASKLPTGGYTEQGRFEPWLFRVTMNRIRDEMRRQRRHADPTDPTVFQDHDGGDRPGGPAPGPEASSGAERLASLRSAVGRLSEDDRQVVELRHQGGLSFKQIADVLDEPLGTVLARHHRALKKIKQLIEQADAEGEAAGASLDGAARGDDR